MAESTRIRITNQTGAVRDTAVTLIEGDRETLVPCVALQVNYRGDDDLVEALLQVDFVELDVATDRVVWRGLEVVPTSALIDEISRRSEPVGEVDDVRRCRSCGCTDDMACLGGCSWVAADLCSSCTGGAETRP